MEKEVEKTPVEVKKRHMRRRNVTTSYLDELATPFLEQGRECYRSGSTQEDIDALERGLRAVRAATQRMGSENNRVGLMLKVAKAVGVPVEEQKIIWRQIADPEPSE